MPLRVYADAILVPVPTTSLPELAVAEVRRWCEDRVPAGARHQVRVECEADGRQITIIERRAPWREDFGPDWTRSPVARLRYTRTTGTWQLFWRDRNLAFHAYERLAPSPVVADLLAEIDRDPTLVFWG